MFSFKPGRQTELAITATCLQAFLLFGYDQGVFGGLVTNVNFLNTFGRPSSSLLGIIVSIYNIGCLTGCIANFLFGQLFGRRQAIWAAMAFICLGAVVQTSAYGVPQMMVGRIITGFGVGIDTSTVPMYQSELCKPRKRGRLVSTELLFVALGITFAYFYGFGLSFAGGALAWRLPIASQILFAIPIAILMIPLPESPRWLIQKGRVEEATKVLMQNYDVDENDRDLQIERKSIIDTCELERKAGFHWTHLFKKDAVQTGWRIFLSCLILTMNQWTGINVVVFYAAVVLESNVGLDHQTALIVGGCLNLAFALGGLVPSFGADKFGRRKLMMFGCTGMSISMMLISILLSFQTGSVAKHTATASIAFFLLYMIFFGISMAGVPWCYSAEILPLHIRASGVAIAVMFNWISVFTIVMVTPIMVANITWKTYLIFMITNAVFVPTVYFLFPETANKALEEIDMIFLKRDRLTAEEQVWVDAYDRDRTPENGKDIRKTDIESKLQTEMIEECGRF